MAEAAEGDNDHAATTTTTKHYLYGCSQYEYVGFHCDPIQNEFESSTFVASYTKVASATRQPDYVPARFGEGVQVSLHSLESMRANVIDAYDSERFSVYASVKPDNSDKEFSNGYATLVSYRNGVYSHDVHDAGWQIQFVPNPSNDESVEIVRFTVFNSNGTGFSPPDATIPADRFSEILGSFDGRNVRLFVDGEMKGETMFNGTYTGSVSRSNFLNIAGDAYCTCELASGVIDEVRYYNYSMVTAEQVKRDIDSISEEEGLVGYWKFDGDLKDYSPYGNDLFYNTMISSAAFAPDGRLFYNEKNSGNIRVMTMAANGTALLMDEPFASIPEIHVSWDQGLLGLAIDSRFRENHFVYAYYNYKDESSGDVYARIVRFTDSDNKGIDEKVILDRIPASPYGFHTGGALTFNKIDDKLYVTVGDAADDLRAQNITSLNGKILRMNRDGTVPDDNPFPNSLVYSYGHRNMYGIAFDERGHGLVTEPGADIYDEINALVKGGNFGWSRMQPANVPPDPLTDDSSIKPLRTYFISINPTQAVYYDGDKHPELKGKFIFGSYRGNLYAVKLNEDGTRLVEEWRLKTNFYPSLEVVNVAVSPDGDIYFGAYDIYRLDGIDMSSRVKIMYPVQVNATNNMEVSLGYSEPEKALRFSINDRSEGGSLTIGIPKSFIGGIGSKVDIIPPEEGDSVAAANRTEDPSMMPRAEKIVVAADGEANASYDILRLDIPKNYSQGNDILLVASNSGVNVVRTIPEFGISAAQFVMLASILAIVALTNRRWRKGFSLVLRR
ncbi:PQQ-dependent sugar dehydrogenase [Nitrososphaera sp.]|uniref:PQQ-dependent sugar dehydrogenase n=1 Tax=Nitrososphaera sp. TaxID=1971748 RepID=UPI00307E533C